MQEFYKLWHRHKSRSERLMGVRAKTKKPLSAALGREWVKRFKDLIQQGHENFTVNNQLSPRFLYSDLSLLVGQHWLTFGVIEIFVKIFNRRGSSFTKFYSFVYLFNFEMNGKLKEDIIDWKAKSIDKIYITVNVGLNILPNTFIANSKQRGNHWICFVINIWMIFVL